MKRMIFLFLIFSLLGIGLIFCLPYLMKEETTLPDSRGLEKEARELAESMKVKYETTLNEFEKVNFNLQGMLVIKNDSRNVLKEMGAEAEGVNGNLHLRGFDYWQEVDYFSPMIVSDDQPSQKPAGAGGK